MSKILAQDTEAIITLDKNIVNKNRIPKSYRLKELDKKLFISSKFNDDRKCLNS